MLIPIQKNDRVYESSWVYRIAHASVFVRARDSGKHPVTCFKRHDARRLITHFKLYGCEVSPIHGLACVQTKHPHVYIADDTKKNHPKATRLFLTNDVQHLIDLDEKALILSREHIIPPSLPVTHRYCETCGHVGTTGMFRMQTIHRSCPRCGEKDDVFEFRVYRCLTCGCVASQAEFFKECPADQDPLQDEIPMECPSCASDDGCRQISVRSKDARMYIQTIQQSIRTKRNTDRR